MSGLLGIAAFLALMFFLELPVGLAMGVVGLGGLRSSHSGGSFLNCGH